MITDISKKQKIRIYFLTYIILLFIFRTAIPLFKYPFLVLFGVCLVSLLITFRARIISTIKDFIFSFSILLILALILIISFLFSYKIYLSVFKGLIDVGILFCIFFLLMLVISTRKEFMCFVQSLFQSVILFALLITLFSLFGTFDIFRYTDYYIYYLDYNFALLPVFFGIIGVFYALTGSNSRLTTIIYNLLLILFSFQIFLSGSRRGLIILAIIIFLAIGLLIIGLVKKNEKIKEVISNSKLFLISLIIIPFILYLYTFHASYYFKEKTLEYIGSKDASVAKSTISAKLFRYVSIFEKKLTVSEFRNKIWSISYDPKIPGNGWGTGRYKIAFPLKGKNSELVPSGAKGYLLDRRCKFSHSEHHAYSYTLIGNRKIKAGDSMTSSVYCYVSDDFNGDKACINTDGAVSGSSENCYDLLKKGVWQKLTLSASYASGEAPVYLYFNKLGVTDFSSLKGYVIFAYPQYNIDTSKISQISSASVILQASIVSKDNKSRVNEVSLFTFHLPFMSIIPKVKDKDPIRNFFIRFISEDTTYHGYKSEIKLDTLFNPFLGQRLMRWQFAFQIFSKEYSLTQKMFGGGFSFLNWYGYYFLADKSKSDYPHNPLLYILLYSGLLGLIIYLLFMYKVFYLYLKYFRQTKILFSFFLITLFFTFFSGGNPFDPPMMGFFVILPFFFHYIQKKSARLLPENQI
jgi:hypothetical protein